MEQPIEQTTYVGWSNLQVGLAMLLAMALVIGCLTALLYVRMGDVTDALRAQAVSCAAATHGQ